MKLLRIRLVKGCFLLFHQVYLAEYIVYYILQELKKSIISVIYYLWMIKPLSSVLQSEF